MKKGIPVVLRAEWQENSAKPCDTGTAISEMQKEWPQFDWSSVDPEYPSKKGLYEFSKKGLTQRGIEARKWLRERPEKGGCSLNPSLQRVQGRIRVLELARHPNQSTNLNDYIAIRAR